MEKRVITPNQCSEDKTFDLTLRPKVMYDFVGQDKIKDNLKISIEAAKKRKEALEHILFCGPAGTGKTSLSYIVAREMSANIKTTSGPAIEKAGDLAAILTNLQDGDILFIDECHRIPKVVEEILYPAMEDYSLDIIIGKGPAARSLKLDLPKFTIIGATTRMGLLSSPLRDRFGSIFRLNYYHKEDIKKIVKRSANILDISIEDEGADEISKRSRKTPRIANRLLKRVRDYAEVKGNGNITEDMAKESLKMMEIDDLGLDDIDRKILKIIIEKFNGGPCGLQVLSSITSEEQDTLEEVYEPYLLQLGFIARTQRGRVATEEAYRHLGLISKYKKQDKLNSLI
jgi:Holliday junction DNA helicase RuvB